MERNFISNCVPYYNRLIKCIFKNENRYAASVFLVFFFESADKPLSSIFAKNIYTRVNPLSDIFRRTSADQNCKN